MVLFDPCAPCTDAESCSQKAPLCSWSYTAGHTDGKCTMTPTGFLQASSRHDYVIGKANELAAPIMAAFAQVISDALPEQSKQQVLASLNAQQLINVDWLEGAVRRQMQLQQSNDWAQIAAAVVNDISNELCPLCLEGHDRLDSVKVTACCKMMLHRRCYANCNSKCPTCSQGSITTPAADALVAAGIQQDLLLALQPGDLVVFLTLVVHTAIAYFVSCMAASESKIPTDFMPSPHMVFRLIQQFNTVVGMPLIDSIAQIYFWVHLFALITLLTSRGQQVAVPPEALLDNIVFQLRRRVDFMRHNPAGVQLLPDQV